MGATVAFGEAFAWRSCFGGALAGFTGEGPAPRGSQPQSAEMDVYRRPKDHGWWQLTMCA